MLSKQRKKKISRNTNAYEKIYNTSNKNMMISKQKYNKDAANESQPRLQTTIIYNQKLRHLSVRASRHGPQPTRLPNPHKYTTNKTTWGSPQPSKHQCATHQPRQPCPLPSAHHQHTTLPPTRFSQCYPNSTPRPSSNPPIPHISGRHGMHGQFHRTSRCGSSKSPHPQTIQ